MGVITPLHAGRMTINLINKHDAKAEEEYLNVKMGEEIINSKVTVKIKSVNGHVLYEASDKMIKKAYEKVERKIANKYQSENRQNSPYKALKSEIENITKNEFNNIEKDSKQTFNGFDCKLDGEIVVISVHNAANPIIAFRVLQDSSVVNLNTINVDTFRGVHNSRSYIKMIGAVQSYLQSDVEVRRLEMEESGWKD